MKITIEVLQGGGLQALVIVNEQDGAKRVRLLTGDVAALECGAAISFTIDSNEVPGMCKTLHKARRQKQNFVNGIYTV